MIIDHAVVCQYCLNWKKKGGNWEKKPRPAVAKKIDYDVCPSCTGLKQYERWLNKTL